MFEMLESKTKRMESRDFVYCMESNDVLLHTVMSRRSTDEVLPKFSGPRRPDKCDQATQADGA